MRSLALLLLTLPLGAQAPAEPVTAEDWLNRGVQLFKAGKYEEAAASFQRYVDKNPGVVTGHLYLASAALAQHIPGSDSTANQEFARRAESSFQAALAIEPQNRVGLSGLANLKFLQAQARTDPSERRAGLDESERWYRKVIDADARDKTALYSLGVTAWLKAYPDSQRARLGSQMRPEDPGPIRDVNLRLQFKLQHQRNIEEGMANLRKTLEVDPQYDDAMAYLNLLYRQAADFTDSAEQYRANIAEADTWVHRALEVKKAKASAGIPPSRTLAFAPPPPPPPPGGAQPTASQIRIGGNLQSEKLVYRTALTYPAAAREARIQGAVRLEAVIAKDGSVAKLTLVNGHPLLVPSALEAVQQWRYRPTLLNGLPVEVITLIDVNFRLDE
jgi:TonB family protein